MQRGLAQASHHDQSETRSPTSPPSTTQHGLHRPLPDAAARENDNDHDVRHADRADRAAPPPDGIGAVDAVVRASALLPQDLATVGGADGAAGRAVDVKALDALLRRVSSGHDDHHHDDSSAPSVAHHNHHRHHHRHHGTGKNKKATASVAAAGQRITAYERALTTPSPAATKRRLAGKQVVLPAAARGTRLNDFPNEILTHVFSYLQPGSHASVALVSKRFYSLITTPHAWRMAFLRFFPGQESLRFSAAGPPLPPSSSSHGTSSPVDDDGNGLRSSGTRAFARLTPLASWRSEYLLRTRLLRSLMSGKPGASVGGGGSGGGGGTGGNGSVGGSSSHNNNNNTGNKPLSHNKRATAVVTYNSHLMGVVDTMHAVFTSTSKRPPRVVHGFAAWGLVTASNPTIGKIEAWGLRDDYAAPRRAAAPNVLDVSALYGAVIGEGSLGGRPLYRAMGDHGFALLDESSTAAPFLNVTAGDDDDDDDDNSNDNNNNNMRDMPAVPAALEAVSAVWLAKTPAVPLATQSMVGMLVGTSLGRVSAYSLNKADSGARFPYSHVTARWVLSPGVPIVAVHADDSYTAKRRQARRVWAVALNALGEVYCLQDVPVAAPPVTSSSAAAATATATGPPQARGTVHERRAWQAGRTAQWVLVEPTRRVVTAEKVDLRSELLRLAAAPSPSPLPLPLPSSSSLSSSSPGAPDVASPAKMEQRVAEAHAAEKFFQITPTHFQTVYGSWDTGRKLEVDFAAGGSVPGASNATDGAHGTGECVFVVDCGAPPAERAPPGLQAGTHSAAAAKVTRYTRLVAAVGPPSSSAAPLASAALAGVSLFPSAPRPASPVVDAASMFSGTRSSGQNTPTERSVVSTPLRSGGDATPRFPVTATTVGWQVTHFSLHDKLHSQAQDKDRDGSEGKDASAQITCCATDRSMYALVAPFEDPLLQSDEARNLPAGRAVDIPGRRARWLAVGTQTGAVVVWNMRDVVSSSSSSSDSVWPVRVIQTDSPTATSLAVSALYLVHGGSDGLVQAWDPLASTVAPVRTLNARGAGRVPRYLAHVVSELPGAANNNDGGNNNSLAAVRAIMLDPDPTVLRGVLAVGPLVRYWSYSSSASAAHSANRKRQRRLRHTNVEGQLASRRLGVKVTGLIAAETAELRHEQAQDRRHRARMLRRFGVGLAGLTDEEAVQYAEIVSAEEALQEQQRLLAGDAATSERSSSSTTSSSSSSSSSSTGLLSPSSSSSSTELGSNAGTGISDAGVSVSGSSNHSATPGPSLSRQVRGPSNVVAATADRSPRGSRAADVDEDDDFELQMQRAMRLSLMEGVHNNNSNGGGDDTSAYAYDDTGALDFPVTFRPAKREDGNKGKGPAATSSSPSVPSADAGPSRDAYAGGGAAAGESSQPSLAGGHQQHEHLVGDNEDDDLQLALRLSLQEEEARQQRQQQHQQHPQRTAAMAGANEDEQFANDAALAALLQEDEFPALEVTYKGKGKGKGKGV